MNSNNNPIRTMNTGIQHRDRGVPEPKEHYSHWLPTPANHESEEQRWRRQGKLQ